MIVGNDISQFQGKVDWTIYPHNTNFVIIRSTYGNGYYDSWFANNRDQARLAGVPHGFYHYCYPQLNSATDEASWFCKAVYDLQEGESLYLDFEETSYTGDVVAWCKTFLDYVATHFNGTKPMIYLNQSLASRYDWTPVINAGYALWLASYQADGTGNTGQWSSMAMQQTSSSQQVPGLSGNVDRDVFFGDANQFKAYGYKKPMPVPPPVVTPPTTPPVVVPPVVEPPVTPQPIPTPTPVDPTLPYKAKMAQINAIASKFHWFYSGDFKAIKTLSS